jgi:hypothetical protein
MLRWTCEVKETHMLRNLDRGSLGIVVGGRLGSAPPGSPRDYNPSVIRVNVPGTDQKRVIPLSDYLHDHSGLVATDGDRLIPLPESLGGGKIRASVREANSRLGPGQ